MKAKDKTNDITPIPKTIRTNSHLSTLKSNVTNAPVELSFANELQKLEALTAKEVVILAKNYFSNKVVMKRHIYVKIEEFGIKVNKINITLK